jgi:hypothetical protein
MGKNLVSGPGTGQPQIYQTGDDDNPVTAARTSSLSPIPGAPLPEEFLQRLIGPDLLSQLPNLPDPSGSPLSLESLVKALGEEDRRLAVQSGLKDIESNSKERKEYFDKQIKEIETRAAKMAEKTKKSFWSKLFSWVTTIVSVIAAAATVAAGILSANPLLIAGGIILSVMAVDGIVSQASDGKYSLAAGVGEIAKKCGASDATAQKIGMGVSIGITVLGVALSLGASGMQAYRGYQLGKLASDAARVGSQVTQAAAEAMTQAAVKATSTLGKVVKAVEAGSALFQAAASIGKGALQIEVGKLDRDITSSWANSKEFRAILDRIAQAIETESDFIDSHLKRSRSLYDTIMNIINESNQTQHTILSGGGGFSASPALA